jgi:ABC-type polysaccharide/polyol phosphate transport system ATPase subunit
MSQPEPDADPPDAPPPVVRAVPHRLPTLPAIEVDGVSATYRVRVDTPGLVNDLRRLIRPRVASDRLVPALRDVSFDVAKGSVLAVIGRNGAGKSTLVRVIGGILPPAAGRVTVRGRLNVLTPGLGFNQALTGRENIVLGGLALGLDAHRLRGLVDEIAEFAQLGDYVELPMHSYSTGMRMRLASAIAVFLDPEVLLIDEALTGGDAAFMAHIADKVAQLTGEGRTIVLVTHGLSSVRNIATDALWLHQGRVIALGDPDDVVAQYMRWSRLENLTFDDS